MREDHTVVGPNIEEIRERAIEVLTEHFSRDVMNLDEFEGMLDAVDRCSTPGELRELLRKLPPLETSEPATDMIPAGGGAPVVVDADRVRDHGFLIGILGGNNRAGRWIPARKNFILGMLGGVNLDFREALLGPGVTDLNVLGLLGGVHIIVPPEMAVEVDGMALLGGVHVQVRLPGETNRDTKRRRRLERREIRRRLRSGQGLLNRTNHTAGTSGASWLAEQCSSYAAFKVSAISSGWRPSIWWRSSMKTSSPSFIKATAGDDGG